MKLRHPAGAKLSSCLHAYFTPNAHHHNKGSDEPRVFWLFVQRMTSCTDSGNQILSIWWPCLLSTAVNSWKIFGTLVFCHTINSSHRQTKTMGWFLEMSKGLLQRRSASNQNNLGWLREDYESKLWILYWLFASWLLIYASSATGHSTIGFQADRVSLTISGTTAALSTHCYHIRPDFT